MNKLLRLFILFLFANITLAQTVEFQVHMGVEAFHGRFTVGDTVKIAGNFNGWNTGTDVLTDPDNDTIYTITKTLNAGDTLVFKFIKGVAGWENVPNRYYIVPASNSTYFAFFNNFSQYSVPDSIDITFACNMESEIILGRFNPATDTLSVRGNFNGWTAKNLLFSSAGNPNIYENTFRIFTFEGETIIHKFAYSKPDGPAHWENDPNKTYTITSEDMDSGYVNISRYFNYMGPPPVTVFPVTIKFTVDMAGAISAINSLPFPSIDDVRICGENAPLQWPDIGWPNADSSKTIKLYDNGTNGDVTSGDNIWSRDVIFPKYTSFLVFYKYAANWGLTSNNGGNNNENVLYDIHDFYLTRNILSATVENVFGTMGTHPLVNVVTDVKELISEIPSVYALEQNYPNPFNPSTTIRFSIPEADFISLKVFNVLGEEVAIILSEEKSAGNYEVTYDASILTSGIYFYTISGNNFIQTKKMLLLK